MSLSFLMLLAAFSALSEYALRYSTDRIRDERLTLTRVIAVRLDEVIQDAVEELEESINLTDFNPLEPGLSYDVLQAHRVDIDRFFASGVVFLDTEGRVLLSDRPDTYALSMDMSDLPYISEVLQSHEFAISEPSIYGKNNQPVAAITIPIIQDGQFVGLVSGQLKLNGAAFLDVLQLAASLGETGHATLIDNQGRALAATLEVPLLSSVEHPDFYPQAASDGQPTVGTTMFEMENIEGETYGENHVMAYVPLKMAPWGVAIGGDEDKTFDGVWQLRNGLALLAGITMILVWVGTYFGVGKLIKPIQELTIAAEKVANGNLHTSLQISGLSEIKTMATSLDLMRIQLLTNTKEHLAIQENERARLARELHDEIGQMLTAIGYSLEHLAESLPNDEDAQERLEYSRTLVEKTVFDLRRVISALRPSILDQLGLIPALKWTSEQLFLKSPHIEIKFDTDRVLERLPEIIETILFRIAQEAMNNVARHSEADHLEIKFRHENGQITMTLIDDGRGFDPSFMSSSSAGLGLGLAGMKERATLIGGQITITSALQEGTTITAVIPTTSLST